MSKVVKIKFLDFSYWASSTPWGHVLSLKTFCWNPVLSWAIRYSVFQLIVVKTCLGIRFQLFIICWSSLDIINYFKAISRIVFFHLGEINKSFFSSKYDLKRKLLKFFFKWCLLLTNTTDTITISTWSTCSTRVVFTFFCSVTSSHL